MDVTVVSPAHPSHNRSRSTGILKSIIKPSSRTPSPRKRTATGVPNSVPTSNIYQDGPDPKSILPLDHPHAGQSVLGEIHNEGPPRSPRKSSTSPKKPFKKPAAEHWDKERDTVISPAESALLTSQPKAYFQPKERENITPPRSSNTELYTPIWAQFTSRPDQEISRLQKSEVSAKSTVKDEINKYKPQGHSPAKSQRPGQSVRERPQRMVRPESIRLQSAATSRTSNDSVHQKPVAGAASASPKKQSKVMAAVAKLNGKAVVQPAEPELDGKQLDDRFEAMLVARNIPSHRRPQMRGLDVRIKRDFVKHDQPEPSSSEKQDGPNKSFFSHFRSGAGDRSSRKRAESSADDASFDNDKGSPSKRTRSRSRTFTFSKRSRSNSRPRSLMSLKNLSSSSVNSTNQDRSQDMAEKPPLAVPNDFVVLLKAEFRPQKVEVGKIHKLRLLLRNETVTWVETFVSCGGMNALVDLLRSIMKIEWREEHEDLLLHEVLLCLKGLCTTRQALERLAEIQTTLFPELLKMLFDDEKKGPSEYSTRSIIISLLFTHLSAAMPEEQTVRANELLSHLIDPCPLEDERPAGFITQMQQKRPYQLWCREVTNVTKEVFWIFLHHLNVIATNSSTDPSSSETYASRHFPRERPPVPAAPYVGGVEWEATNYLAAHLDLMNGLIASVPSSQARNELRAELKASGFEKVMGGTLRLCKEKFYGAVHDGLRTWVAAGLEDKWDVHDVRMGPPKEMKASQSPTKYVSPKKNDAPRLDLPALSLDAGKDGAKNDGWL